MPNMNRRRSLVRREPRSSNSDQMPKRHIFGEQEFYTLADAASRLGWSKGKLNQALTGRDVSKRMHLSFIRQPKPDGTISTLAPIFVLVRDVEVFIQQRDRFIAEQLKRFQNAD